MKRGDYVCSRISGDYNGDYNPSIFPVTLSTASLRRRHSRTTPSFSSSAHSIMNVAVSGPNPIRRRERIIHIRFDLIQFLEQGAGMNDKKDKEGKEGKEENE